LCADHPELLDELRRQVEALREQGAPVLPSAPPTRAGADTRCSVDGDGPTEPDPAGLALPRYEILGILGRGGVGGVHQARQTSLKRIVALKRIRAGTDASPEDLARFRAEAEAVAQLQHPNIVQVYEVGEQGGLPFFSLEYVDGGSLDRRLTGTP